MKIAHFGTFDVNNYGDLLFPHIARYRWPDCKWIHVSPTNSRTFFSDSIPVINVNQAYEDKFDAVIVGGGNIIQTAPTSLKEYREVRDYAYPSLWLGAARLASIQRIPIAFNAPGIYESHTSLLERKLFAKVFSDSVYLSFRDYESAKFASSLVSKDVLIVADTAFDIDKMWQFPKIFDDDYLVVNLNKRYHSPPELTARTLNIISQKLKLPIRFIIIGECHGDLDYTIKVKEHMTCNNQIVDITSLQDMAKTIRNSSYFIGSSMHAFITALAYKVPSLLILNENPMRKFRGLLKLTNLEPEVICPTWEQTIKQIDYPQLIEDNVRDAIKETLDRHWSLMRERISDRKDFPKSYLINNWQNLLKLNREYQKFRYKNLH